MTFAESYPAVDFYEDRVMSYSAKAVANYFLERAFDEGIELSPMKLQKLLYYAQGWHLGFTGKPIFNEQVECWKYGPVVSSVFHHFKEFGSDPIDRLAVTHRLAKGDGFRFSTSRPSLSGSVDSQSSEILNAVWQSYKAFSAIKLSNMTHDNDSPWSTVMRKCDGQPPRGTDIPMSLMQRHFRAETKDDE